MSTLPDKLTCGNGHTFSLPDEAGSDEEIPCPECGESVPRAAKRESRTGGKGRSLWAVMQSGGEPADTVESKNETPSVKTATPAAKSKWNVVEPASDVSTEGDSDADASEQVDIEFCETESSPENSQEERPRGLWAMMGQGPQTISPVESSPNNADEVRETADDEGASLEELLDGDGDFEVRRGSDGEVPTSAGESRPPRDTRSSSEPNGLNTSRDDSEDDLLSDDLLSDDLLSDDQEEEDGWEVDEYDEDDAESVAATSLAGSAIEVPLPDGPVVIPGAQTAVLALGFGVAAFVFAGLNLLPEFWAKIPSSVAGLAALVWGYQSLNESRRSVDRARLQLMAGAGLACGLIGMFAGPLALNAVGDGWREEQLRGAITKNLKAIGEGVEVFYEQHGAFPRATYVVDGNVDVPMHSWMSALLPHMGYNELALGIDRKKPYDDPANFNAMSTIVPTFLVPNVDHQPTLRGLATAHFAGVGGETLTDAGQVDVGVFSRGMTITRDMLTDGASQTMLAGEITRALPAWGEPGNWRTIGRGLNRQVSGFGNSAGTGAHFLMADGSVKFFPNSTSRDVLVRLSTRNGGDPVAVPE